MKISTLGLLLFLCGINAFAQTAPAPTPTPDAAAAEKQRIERLQARLNDFANFTKYREANSKTSAPAKDENRVVFMGDSITDFWRLNEFFPGQPYINRGISGQMTSQMLLRFRSDVIDLKPKVVIILAGTNDISIKPLPNTLEAIKENLMSMAEIARANKINVVIASLLPVSDYAKDKNDNQIIRTVIRPPAQITEINEWIKKYVAENKLIYLDYYTATVDDKGLLKADISSDGLHPNAKGYEIMKPLVEKAIAEALKKKQSK